MNKKKYILYFILMTLCCFSCGNESQSFQNSETICTIETEWSYNEEYHFHNVICPIIYNDDGRLNGQDVLPKDYAPHEFDDYSIINKATDNSEGTRQRKCNVCGYVQTETYKINSVKEAINSKDNYEIYVKGIVGPSLCGQLGFYIIDENGSIACLVSNKDEMNRISIGDEVILKGTRKTYNDQTLPKIVGQSVIENVTVDENRYGNHEYSTKSFINDLSLKDISSFFMHINHTTEIYTLKATIGYEESDNYTHYDIIQGAYRIELYSDGNKDEYSFLYPYINSEVEMEIAICNFEFKYYYKTICLSINVDNNKILNCYNFTK